MTSHNGRTTPRWLLALIAVLVAVPLTVLVAGPASAHTKLVSSNPAEGEALPTAPKQIVLTFNEVPASVTSVKAQDTNGPLVALGDPVQNGATVTVSWPQDQAPGLFRLVYVLVSDDGDPVEGTLLFSYAAAGSGSSAGSGSAGGCPSRASPRSSDPQPFAAAPVPSAGGSAAGTVDASGATTTAALSASRFTAASSNVTRPSCLFRLR